MDNYKQEILDCLAYEVEIHCATLDGYRSKKSTPKNELKRYENIVAKSIQTLRNFFYTSEMAKHNYKKTPRVYELIKQSEELEKLV